MKMHALGSLAVASALVLGGMTGIAQQTRTPTAPPPIPWPSPTLAEGPIVLDTAIQHQIRLVVTKGLNQPWSLAFLPNGSILVTERPGRLRIVRDGVLDPAPGGAAGADRGRPHPLPRPGSRDHERGGDAAGAGRADRDGVPRITNRPSRPSPPAMVAQVLVSSPLLAEDGTALRFSMFRTSSLRFPAGMLRASCLVKTAWCT